MYIIWAIVIARVPRPENYFCDSDLTSKHKNGRPALFCGNGKPVGPRKRGGGEIKREGGEAAVGTYERTNK